MLKEKKAAPAALVVGGLPEGRQLDAIRKGAQLVVATPGRLEDYLDRRLVSLSGVATLVLDEADRMLDMGFLPAIKRIASVLPKERQTLCFSATMEGAMTQLVRGLHASRRAVVVWVDVEARGKCAPASV
jgi:ATP-dependent RNA helicase RhlE